EEPEAPLDFPEAAEAVPPRTIGQFYAEIQRQIVALGNGAFSKTPRNQIGPDRMDGAVVVTNVQTASQAIDTIVEQGEGTPQPPLGAPGSQASAHSSRSAEVKQGTRLIKTPAAGPNPPPEQRYLYGGAAIPFTPAGVFAAPRDPRAANSPAGSAARH